MRIISFFVLAALLGCGGAPQPAFDPLYPATGVVTKAGQPVVGGSVQFLPIPDNQAFMINSEVGTDGRFNLTTVRTTDTRGERKPGAPAGQYRVSYQAPVADQTTGTFGPVTAPKEATIASQDNDLKIELP